MSSIYLFNRTASKSRAGSRNWSHSAAEKEPKTACVLCARYIFSHQEKERLPLGSILRGSAHLPCKSRFLADPEAYFNNPRDWRKEAYE